MSTTTRIAILGFHDGNAGQVAEWIEAATGFQLAAFVIDAAVAPVIDVDAENARRVSQRMEFPTGGQFKGRPLVVSDDWPTQLAHLDIHMVLPLVSDNLGRRVAIEKSRRAGFELVSAIHPTATVLDQAEIEPGCWVNARAVIGYKVELRSGAMVNTGAQVDHHSILESCTQIDPGVLLAGHVTIRELAHVHTGAVLINRITVGRDATVGAGAVVRHDVAPGLTVVGNPARELRRREPR